jgi:two-component system response regulator FixJ
VAIHESTVFVVDDDEFVRKSLQRLLREVGLEVELYSDAAAFIEADAFDRPGCVLLDIRMPGMSGIELHQRMLDEGSTIPIIMITGHGDVTMAVECMKRGAFDFIEKPFRAQRLLDSVQAALRLEERLRLRRERRAEARSRFDVLAADEREVALRVAGGRAVHEIAHERGVTEEAVEALLGRALQKLGAAEHADLVRLVDRAKR